MLLDLLQAEIAQHRVPVSSLCIAAAVPATTALRWIKTMTDAGLFKRRADPHDGRRVFVELSPNGQRCDAPLLWRCRQGRRHLAAPASHAHRRCSIYRTYEGDPGSINRILIRNGHSLADRCRMRAPG